MANLDRTILHSSDNILESVVEIFPNPARNEITVNLNDNLSLSDLLFEIYNIEGKLIQSESLIDIVTRMNVSNFANGVYNYRLVKGGRAIDSGKFVLN